MSVSEEQVLQLESAPLQERREHLFGVKPTEKHLADTLFGVCFSGGGIRSATFNLGILQGLAALNVLKTVDYLSTVSGGGYIGSWFHGLIKRQPYKSLKKLDNSPYSGYEEYLKDEDRNPGDPASDPITFLRKYSNYLAPQLGFFSTDLWVVGTIWFRNAVLNQIIFYLIALTVVLLPLTVGNGAQLLAPGFKNSIRDERIVATLIVGLLAWVVLRMSQDLKPIVIRELGASATNLPGGESADDDLGVWLKIVLPHWAAALALSFFIGSGVSRFTQPRTFTIAGIILLGLFTGSLLLGGYWRCYRERHKQDFWWIGRGLSLALLYIIACAAVTLALLILLEKLLSALNAEALMPHSISWGPPLVTLVLAAGVGLQIGLMGVDFPDGAREWYSRFCAKLLILSTFWAALFGLSLFVPGAVLALFHNLKPLSFAAVLGWIITTIAGILSGKSPLTKGRQSDGPTQQKSPTLELIAKYAPPLAVAGVFVALSTSTYWAVAYACRVLPSLGKTPLSLQPKGEVYLICAAACLFILGLLLSCRFNINEFSMNHFYKNRLVRCYLGASAGAARKPNPFTGFDPQDDILLKDLLPGKDYPGPFAIINCALNLNHGAELAWQERKATSFVFTPLFCGYRSKRDSELGFVPTVGFTQKPGPRLGTATSISGAAANPNWGYHTQPVTAFLLALFDVRLGWWVGNTRLVKPPATPGPSVAFRYLLSELFGLTNEDSSYVDLSDGGHFENLGLYELLRRKCRFIIVGDGEQDNNYEFESLGGAIRKARIDFGAFVDISPKRIFLEGGLSEAHYAIGTVTYQDGSTGVLLYLKASLTGDEAYDITQYKKSHSDFPNDSTMNQFFTESQFESYRSLGRHIVEKVFNGTPQPNTPADLQHMFAALQKNCQAPAAATIRT